jgi:hypothetical protein
MMSRMAVRPQARLGQPEDLRYNRLLRDELAQKGRRRSPLWQAHFLEERFYRLWERRPCRVQWVPRLSRVPQFPRLRMGGGVPKAPIHLRSA